MMSFLKKLFTPTAYWLEQSYHLNAVNGWSVKILNKQTGEYHACQLSPPKQMGCPYAHVIFYGPVRQTLKHAVLSGREMNKQFLHQHVIRSRS